MRHLWTFLVALLALLAALAAGLIAETQYASLVATTELVVPAEDIPPYTIVSPEMFKLRSFPAPLANEPVYRSLDEIAGKITTVPLRSDELVYRDQLVPLGQFHYSDDPRLEVVSFPVSPEQAVGGQIEIGQRINLYRLALGADPSDAAGAALLANSPVAVDLLAHAVPVVDVRAAGGSRLVAPSAPTPAASGGLVSPAEPPAESSAKPLTIITIAVPPATARDIVRLMGETHERYLLWVTLTPPVEVR